MSPRTLERVLRGDRAQRLARPARMPRRSPIQHPDAANPHPIEGLVSRSAGETDVSPPKFPKRVALLTSAVLPYRIGLFAALNARISHFKVFVSEPLATQLSLPDDWQVDVAVQRTLGINAIWRHPRGFREPMRVLVPYDTMWQLSRYAPDIVVSGEMGLRTLQSLAYRRLHPSTRLILWGTVSEENELGRDRWRRALRRWMLPRVDGVITNGKSGARY